MDDRIYRDKTKKKKKKTKRLCSLQSDASYATSLGKVFLLNIKKKKMNRKLKYVLRPNKKKLQRRFFFIKRIRDDALNFELILNIISKW